MSDLVERFNIPIDVEDDLYFGEFINGYDYPNLPIITNDNSDIISTSFHWGLVPSWAKELDIRKNTLNARIETINEKPSYKNITDNRCLIIATGFYEWRWLDEKGKVKEKYLIKSQESDLICFAGLYNRGKNPQNGEPYFSYTMLTTQANEIMQYVHNHKLRMPVILQKKDESTWLDASTPIKDFAYPSYESKLIAFKVS